MSTVAKIVSGPGALRLLLATLVVVQHLSRARIGLTAVMVFFVLSGYWVSRMLDEKYNRPGRPVRQFYLSRFLRLWPAYVAAVFLAILLSTAFGAGFDLRDLGGLALFGAATLHRDPLGISWSLDIEVQFYLILPFLALCAVRYGLRGLLVVAVICVPFGWWLVSGFRIWTVFQYLPLFLAGFLIWRQNLRPGGWLAILSVGLFVVAGVVLFQIDATRGAVLAAPLPKVHGHLTQMLWALLLVPFVAWNVRQPSGQQDRTLGDLSYSLYLVHYPIIEAFKTFTHGDLGTELKLAIIAVSAVVALLFWYVIDRPIEAWRARLFQS